MKSHAPGLFLRWAARLLSMASLGILLTFMVGEGFSPFHLAPREALLCLFFPLGLMAGLVLGWWRETAGGVLGLASLAGFYLIHFAQAGRFPGGVAFALLALPAVLFLAAAGGRTGTAIRPRAQE